MPYYKERNYKKFNKLLKTNLFDAKTANETF